MAVTVVPQVIIDGAAVACDPDKLDTAPVAIRGFTIDWGRDEYLTEQGKPSVARITMLDTTHEWSRLIRSNLAMGIPVRIEWAADTGERSICFRGRVAEATATPAAHHASDNRRAWLVELTCSDYSADLGNVRPVPGIWPRETLLDRIIRIRDLGKASGAQIAQMYTHTRHHGDYVAPLEVRDESALSLMQDLYTSTSNETYTYNHGTGNIDQVVRLQAYYSTSLVAYDTDLGSVSIAPDPIEYDGNTYPGLAVGACEAASDIELRTSPDSALNRVEITYPAFELNHDDARISRQAIRPGDAPRVLDFDSWLESTPVIDEMADYVLDKAIDEGARPKHPSFTLKKGHAFRSLDEARYLLATWESMRPAFLNGDLPYRWLMQGGAVDYLPVVCPIGGTLEFHGSHGWAVNLNVQWLKQAGDAFNPATWKSLMQIRTTYTQPSYPWWWTLVGGTPPKPVPVGSHAADRDIRWGDADRMAFYGMDRSVMWGDMAHVSSDKTQIKDL